MTLIDTSAWVEFFRKRGDRATKHEVARLLDLDEAAYSCPIYFELRAGARDQELALIEETFSFCRREIFQPGFWQRAADLERQLRRKGVTVPRDDIFVATVALEKRVEILCRDHHFDTIREAGIEVEIRQFA